jgi:hypothetical protein
MRMRRMGSRARAAAVVAQETAMVTAMPALILQNRWVRML